MKCSKEKAKAIQAAFDKAVRDATTLHQEIRKGEFTAQSRVHIINSKGSGVDDVLASRSDEKGLKLA
ncbi:hypothetical protein EBI00_00480 [Marinomonas hwangdonensis]|uniref:Uncharacterized protein n=1 Tax=Marinomonas hwangdonensis TaxID=1053647 RepID=A0A3M8QBT9_9GAMM|nr:hypothetical protein EBI00_00480 [Marinomonas hwangdonensis]